MPNKSVFVNATIFNTFTKFVVMNAVIALVLNFIFAPQHFFSLSGIWSVKSDILFSFLMSTSLSYGGFVVETYFDKRISWIEKPVQRLFLTAGMYLSYSFIVSFVLITGYVLLTIDEVNLTNISWMRMLKNTIMPITVAVIIISVFIARSWLYEWRNAALETEKLKSAVLASQNQFLKDQLNPHFLFNSLNTLSNLVYEDAEKSAAFINQLSKIYRYVLDVQQEELVSIQQELGFARNYLSLQQIRFDKNLEYEIKVEENAIGFLPPLSLQLLLENAIKHNIVSMEKPLKISIEIKGDNLVVSNNLQKKIHRESESGIGLANIRKRYELLSKQKIEVIENKELFVVKLPLLKVE